MHLELARAPADDERPPVLGDARLGDRVDELEGVLDDEPVGNVQEHPAGPEGGVGRLELVAVDRQALGEPFARQLGVALEGLLQRAQDHAALGQLRVELDVHDRAGALHDPPGPRALRDRALDDLRHALLADARAQRVEVEALQARRPEARAAPDGQLGGLEGFQRGLAQLRQRAPVARAGPGQRLVERRLAVAARLFLDGAAPLPPLPGRRRDLAGLRHPRHQRPRPHRPPVGSGRSPRARGARPARRRPRARSGHPSGCGRTGAARSAGCAGNG